MAVFRFRLQQVLRLQQAVENMEKRELQERLAIVRRAELTLAQAQAQRTLFVGRLQQTEAAGVSAAELVTARQWHPVLLDLELQRELEQTDALEAADKQREQVRSARLERRTLEQLQERQEGKFDLLQEQLVQTALDELAVQRWPLEERL